MDLTKIVKERNAKKKVFNLLKFLSTDKIEISIRGNSIVLSKHSLESLIHSGLIEDSNTIKRLKAKSKYRSI